MPETASAALRRLASTDPGRAALVTRDGTTTYAELDAAVDQLAAWLTERAGLAGTDLVALRFRRTAALIVSSLAIARSGLVVTLVDPTAPPERVRTLLADLAVPAPPVFLTDLPDDVAAHPGAVLLADAQAAPVGGPPPSSAERGAHDLQSVVHTSGSSGVPTALRVDGTQRQALHGWVRTLDAFRDGARVGVVAAGSLGQAASFPLTVVSVGGTMHVHEVLVDGLDGIPRWLREDRVEAVGLVPTLVRFLLPLLDDQLGPAGVLPDLATVAVWGESSSWADVAGLLRHLPPGATVANAYATTETGMIAALVVDDPAAVPDPPEGRVPAGRPLPGVGVTVVDPAGAPVPAGTPGEVVVASGHLSLGHWRRRDLDDRVFATASDGRRECRTGDRGVLADDGTLHVLGRLDDVVKVSGHRVALGELELAAVGLTGVGAATAAGRPDATGATRLHLWVVPRPGTVLAPRWLRAELARTLPPYALPDTVDVLDALPVLGSGKVDRAALPEPRRGEDAEAGRPAPDRATEVAALFAEVLERGTVGPDEDFFELGGDSLRAGRLVAALQTRLGCFAPASLVIEAPTPAALAAALDSAATDPLLVAVRTDGTGPPLFVLHGGGGEVSFARGLAQHLDPPRPVYALQPPRLVGPTPFAPTLQAMAERYLAEVRRVCPAGPYRLYGYSMGGLLAFEMATLLQELGEEVELLALGDTHSPETLVEAWAGPTEAAERERAERSPVARVRDQLGARRDQARRRLRGVPRRSRQWAAFQAGEEPAPEIRNDAYASVYAHLAYEHRVVRTAFRGDVVLVTASRDGGPADRGWAQHVTGTVHVVPLDAQHADLVREPTLGAVAAALGTTAATAAAATRGALV